MAILLTTEYQLVSTIGLTYGEIRTYAKYTSQSKTNNTTNYSILMTYKTYSLNVNIDSSTGKITTDTPTPEGETTTKSYGYTTFPRNAETTIIETTRVTGHFDDGTSREKHIKTTWTASFGGSGEANADVTFPKIPRYPQMTNATDFNDEENPTITFTNQGIYPVRVKLNARVNNVETNVVTENINQTATNYTFELTTAQRNTLRQLATNNASITIRFYVCAMNGNTELSSSPIDKTMTIVNANPTFTIDVVETNQKVIDLLGTNVPTTVIQNVSTLGITFNTTAYKYATIKETKADDGYTIVRDTTSPYEMSFPITQSGNILYNVIDSRNYYATARATTSTLISYEPLRINSYTFKRESPISSDVILNAEILYYSTLGNINNTPIVKWKLDNGTYTTIPSTEYSIDSTNHKLTITNYEISNVLAYTTQGQFTIYVEDLLTNTEDTSSNGLVLKGIPTFDYGEHDLQVNGDLFIADTNRNNAVNVKNLHKVNITTDGNPVKTGRIIDGKEEYVKRYYIATPVVPNPSYYVDSGLDINDINIIEIQGVIAGNTNNIFSVPNANYNGGYVYVYYRASDNQIIMNCSTQNYQSSGAYINLYFTYKN